MKTIILACIAVLALCVAPAQADEPIPLWFRADITIEPDGQLSALEWRNFKPMPEAVLDGLEAIVPTWEFRPAALDGMPARTDTTLYVRMLASEQGDGSFGLSIANAFVGPSIVEPLETEEPVRVIVTGPLRSSELVLDVTLPPEGAPTLEILDYQATTRHTRYREETEENAREAVAGWNVRHERVAGRPVTAHLRYVYGRCMDSNWCVRNEPASMATLPEMPPRQPTPLDSVAELLTDPAVP